ncbi:ABC transporter permease [Methanococcus maripaludis]|nr:ABC transporter permease [Methanococcus maripaludis]
MSPTELLLGATIQHLELVVTSLIFSIFFGIFFGVISIYYESFSKPIITIANIMYSIPALVIISLIVPILGLGYFPAFFIIFFGSFLPIVKNTHIGLKNINNGLIDAAEGMGLTKWQIIKYIRFPNAYPSIFAGIKFSSILINGMAIITALIGSGGLGRVIFEGLTSFNSKKIFLGTIPAVFIAIFLELFFNQLEKKFTR